MTQTFGATVARHYPIQQTLIGDKTIVVLPTIVLSQDDTLRINEVEYDNNKLETSKIELGEKEIHGLIHQRTNMLLKYLQPSYVAFDNGKKINNYTVIGEIGKGAFAKVYKVKHDFRHKNNAIKILNFYGLEPYIKADLYNRYKLEYQVGQIESQFIIQSCHKGFIKGNPYIICELANGGDLNSIISEKLSISIINKIGLDVLNGLFDLHQHHVVHRDIKPKNIFLSDQTFKIGDFGVSIKLNPEGKNKPTDIIGKSANIIGTPGYMAPELFSSGSVDVICEKIDIFSFGCTMFQVISGGVLPFGYIESKEDAEHYLYNSKKGIFRSLRYYKKELPEYWEDVISKCLEPEPNNRFDSVSEIIDILSEHIAKGNKYNENIEAVFSKYDYDVYFSFAEQDTLLALEILSFLENKGIKVYVPNNVFDAKPIEKKSTEKFLNKAKHLLVLFSKIHENDSVERKHINYMFNEFQIGNSNSRKAIVYNALVDGKPALENIKTRFSLVRSKKDILNIFGMGSLFDNMHLVDSLETKKNKMEEPLKIKRIVLDSIAKNNIAEAIKSFLDYLEGQKYGDDAFRSLVSISSRYKSLDKDKMSGTINYETIKAEENRIILSLNKLVFNFFP